MRAQLDAVVAVTTAELAPRSRIVVDSRPHLREDADAPARRCRAAQRRPQALLRGARVGRQAYAPAPRHDLRCRRGARPRFPGYGATRGARPARAPAEGAAPHGG